MRPVLLEFESHSLSCDLALIQAHCTSHPYNLQTQLLRVLRYLGGALLV